MRKTLQVLAPAGGWPQLEAAVQNGADAVYLGLCQFNARARAENFSHDTLQDAVAFCHARGVRVFVTVNVLIFEQELPAIEEHLRRIAAAGADAIIVQDLAVVQIARRLAPNLPVHGSTQMSITSGVSLAGPSEVGADHVCKSTVRSLCVDTAAPS